MVIERFPPERLDAIYDRFHAQGRGLPEGLHFVESWLSETGDTVWQVMETDDPATFDKWMPRWDDLVNFEIRPLRAKPKPTGE